MCVIFRAYGGFASHFPAQADALLHSLDLSYQKLLYGEASLSNSSSSHSLQSAGLARPPTNASSGPASLPVHPRLKVGSSENLSRLPGIPPRKIAMPAYGSRPGIINGASVPANIRSNSAIDLQAANRAVRNIRGGYVAPLRKFVAKIEVLAHFQLFSLDSLSSTKERCI